jgi:hypothetical protein
MHTPFLKIVQFFLLFFVISVFFLLPSFASAASLLSVGNSWKYQNTQGATISTMEQKVIGEATIFGVSDVAVIERYNSNGSEFNLVLSKEIVGAVYSYKGNQNAKVDFVSGSIGTSWSEVESDGIEQYEIVAVEDIQVPAGIFLGCYKVANSKISQADGSVMSYDERWWHPGTGYVKLDMHIGLSDQEQMVLIEFKSVP